MSETSESWISIKIPKSVYNHVSSLAEKEKVAIWKIIQRALSIYEDFSKKPSAKKDISIVDKISWYILKLVKSVSIFLEKPSRYNKGKVLERINEIKERLIKDCTKYEEFCNTLDTLRTLVNQYEQNSSVQNKITINDTTKLIIKMLIFYFILSSS